MNKCWLKLRILVIYFKQLLGKCCAVIMRVNKQTNLFRPGVLWTLMSIVLAFLSAFSIVSSTWVLQFADSDQNGFGPMKSCRLTVEDNLYFVQHCSYFVLDNGVMNWPSSPFQVQIV